MSISSSSMATEIFYLRSSRAVGIFTSPSQTWAEGCLHPRVLRAVGISISSSSRATEIIVSSEL